MKTIYSILFVSLLLLANLSLFAQHSPPSKAAETLEIELAKKTAPIAEPLLDERQPASQLPTANRQLPPVSPPLSAAEAEELELQPVPVRPIPAPPVDEKQPPAQKILPTTAAPAVPPKAPETNRPSANPNELEAKQHQQNGVRAIPEAPVNEPKKDKSN